MGNTENLLVQVKVDHHQLVGDLRVEGQIQNENLLVHLAIHQTAEPLELQKVHHLGKGQLGRVGSGKKLRRDIRAHLVPVELHEKCHNAIIIVHPTARLGQSLLPRNQIKLPQEIRQCFFGKRALYERYLMGEIDLNTYKAEKAACDELLLKTKNAYAAVLAQAKQKQDEQARQDNRKEASKAIFDADTLTTELAELLIDRVLVYPDKRIEIAYKIQDIFD